MQSDSHTQCAYDLKTLNGHLNYDKAISYHELLKAAEECAAGVMWKSSVIKWMFNKEVNCAKLARQLKDGIYKLKPYIYFNLKCPKPRLISSTRFVDRVVQRSLCNNGLYDTIAKPLIYDNCACLKKKGTKFAQDRFIFKLRKYLRRHGRNGYVVRIDIQKFFDSTPHEILKKILEKHISDINFLHKINEIIDSFKDLRRIGKIPILTNKKCGIGLGSQISQLIMLLYLNAIDHFMTSQLHVQSYVRYMDDIIFICQSKNEAQISLNKIAKKLSELFLVLNSKSTITPLSHDFSFLKVQYRISKSCKIHRKMCKESFRREIQHLKRMRHAQISKENIVQQLNSWIGSNKYKLSRRQLKKLNTVAKCILLE